MRRVFAVLAFAGKEIRQVYRQPKLIAALIIGPFIIMGLFAAGFQPFPPPLRTLLVVPSGSFLETNTESLADDLGAAVEVVDVVEDAEAAQQRLRDGDVELVISAPAEPMATIESGEHAQVTVWHSRVDPFDQSAIQVSATTAVDHLNRAVLAEVIAAGVERSDEAVEALDRAQTSAAALGEAISSSDLERATSARADLDAALASVDSGLATNGFGAGFGDQADDTPGSVAELRSDLDTLDTGDQAALERVEEIEARLGEIKTQITSLAAVPPEVLVEPFVVEVQTVSGIDVPVTTFYTPAVLIVLLQHVVVTLAALSIVSERALGTTEIFRVGPMRTLDIMAGKSLGYGALGAAVAAVLAAGVVFGFGTPMGGSWWWLALVLGLTILASLGLGFAIASLASTDAQVVQFSMLALLFTIFFSGLVVSLDRIAEGIRYVAFLVPATAGTSALHDVMFRGRPPAPLLVVILAGYTVVALLLARQGLRRQQVA